MCIELNRRKFLTAGGISALCALDVFTFQDTRHGPGNYPAEPPNMDGVALVGLWYLSIHPEEADKDLLLSFLSKSASDIDQLDGIVQNGVDDTFVRQASIVDFTRGDVVFAGGWQLARTEARICALIALG